MLLGDNLKGAGSAYIYKSQELLTYEMDKFREQVMRKESCKCSELRGDRMYRVALIKV